MIIFEDDSLLPPAVKRSGQEPQEHQQEERRHANLDIVSSPGIDYILYTPTLGPRPAKIAVQFSRLAELMSLDGLR